MSDANQRLILVTGPAGSGRSTALRALEDLGFEVVDNLPLRFMEKLVEGADGRPLAVGIDARNREFETAQVLDLYRGFRTQPDLSAELLYLDCSDRELVQRYSETRRRHPLAQASTPEDGIAQDKALMAPIRATADVVIDTTHMTVHELRAEIDALYAPKAGRILSVQVQSFSYRRGLPFGMDMVFDVRFLQNPHWVPELRALDGRAPQVAAYVAKDPVYEPFKEHLAGLLALLIPAYKNEGKSYLSIGFGCTGGKHRSVALTETTAEFLQAQGWKTTIRHRELERSGAA